MLNIPEAVKQLYKEETTEQIRKNLRITFPDGQLSDDFPNGITCNNIVAESMRFTESVCSQDNFKFGTSEAPVIEFETVGVPNILGYRIQAWLEIETTTVSDDLTGDYDGEFIALADSDLGFPFYRLPLGVFTVQSCPRSHGAMTHRQTTAYGKTITSNETSIDAFTLWKLSQFYRPNNFTVGFNFFAPSFYGDSWAVAQNNYSGSGTSARETYLYTGGSFSIYFPNLGSGYALTNYPLPTYIKAYRFSGAQISGRPAETLYRLYRTADFSASAAVETIKSNIKTALETLTLSAEDWESSVDENNNTLGSIDACVDHIISACFGSENALSELLQAYVTSTSYGNDKKYVFPDGKIDRIIEATISNGFIKDIVIPDAITVIPIGYALPTGIGNVNVPGITIESELARVTLSTASQLSMPTIKLPYTLTVTREETPNNYVPWYSYYNSYSFPELFGGFFEMRGEFGKVSRAGAIVPMTINNTPTAELEQGEIEALWWDESVVNPVGAVQVSYTDSSTKEESTAVIQIGNGASVYDMTANYYFQKWGQTLDGITALIQSQFAANIAALTWTPTDATTRGLPYLEAGDWITCDTGAEDVTEVGFPILRRELTGIQSLTDTITSVAGMIIEVSNA